MDGGGEGGHSRRERPWNKEELEKISKKELIDWLQQNANNSFLQQHQLQGKVSNVAKKNKSVLIKAFNILFERNDSWRESKDEEETKQFRDTFCRIRVVPLQSLKVIVLRYLAMNIKFFHKELLRKLPQVARCLSPTSQASRSPLTIYDEGTVGTTVQ